MLDWKDNRAETPMARFYRCKLSSGLYSAAIQTGMGSTIINKGGLASEDEVNAWCAAEYARLLQAELARLTQLA